MNDDALARLSDSILLLPPERVQRTVHAGGITAGSSRPMAWPWSFKDVESLAEQLRLKAVIRAFLPTPRIHTTRIKIPLRGAIVLLRPSKDATA